MKITKLENEDFSVEYEILSENEESKFSADLAEIDQQMEACRKKADKLNEAFERYTNDADWLDYTIAVGSGVITGVIDAVVIGELDLKACNEWGSERVNEFVKKVAGEKGNDSEALARAIKKLEDKTKVGFASDPNLSDFGGGKQHHFRDFAHHPTITGWIFSLLTQFTEKCYGTDTKGDFLIVEVKDKERIGKNLQQKFVFGTVIWFLHLVSDMAGTRTTAGKGTGIPGPILSLAKELSVVPPFKNLKIGDMEISKFLSKLFNGTLYVKRDENGNIIKESVIPVDLRTELGIVKTQCMPVIINEVIVRTFYALRRIIEEVKKHPISRFTDLKELNWKRIIPFRNRTIVRMLTISTGTFTAVDMADAAIHASRDAAVAGATTGPAAVATAPVTYVSSFLLRVNFVGIGRFAIAVGSDMKMGMKKKQVMEQRINIYNELLTLTNVKLYYNQAILLDKNVKMLETKAEMWKSAEEASEALYETYQVMLASVNYFNRSWKQITGSLVNISSYVDKIEEKNPGLLDELFTKYDK